MKSYESEMKFIHDLDNIDELYNEKFTLEKFHKFVTKTDVNQN